MMVLLFQIYVRKYTFFTPALLYLGLPALCMSTVVGCGYAPYRGPASGYQDYLSQRAEALSLRASYVPPVGQVSQRPSSQNPRRQDESKTQASEISINQDKALSWVALAKKAGSTYRIEPALILAMMRIESDFNPEAESKAGAKGLMQIMPPTAMWLAKQMNWGQHDATDPVFSAYAGAYYLRHLTDKLGNMQRALAAYNAGVSRVQHWLDQRGALPESVDAYVRRILELRDHYLPLAAI